MASSPVSYGFPQQSPGAFEMQAPAGGDGNTARLMQIKVLYTFDDEKTNCLARCSQPVFVHSLMLEDNTEIGIVELSTCIRAIVSASPELVAKLGQDYTIYAYDYSEYETPLVGQGMLSWALASTSATPTAPADQSRTPVTGRVVKNARSLFPNAGPSEILQVKLKLVPVPKSMQSEYAEGMEKYRDANNFASQGFDPAAWNAFLQARQNFSAPALSPGPPQTAPAMYGPGPQNPTTFFQPSPQANHPQQPPQLVFQANNGAPVLPGASQRASSRPGTPKARRGSNQSRPSSRASNRGGNKKAATMPVPLQRTETAPAAVPTSEPNDPENTQARKRARVEQADWRGPSAFDSGNEPLRVAASAAASMRGHRPSLPGHPSAADIAAAEPGPRPPTPRPNGPRLQRLDSSVSVNQVPAPRPLRYQSPYTMGTVQSDGIGSEAPSPMDEVISAGSTPADIPSSPPVFHDTPAEASSPQFPRDTNDHDSGFVSGNFDEFLNDATEAAPQGENSHADASKKIQQARPSLHSEVSFTEEVPGDPSLLPKTNNQTQRPKPVSRAPSGGQRLGSVPASSPRLPPLIPSHAEATSPPQSMLDTDIAAQSELPAIAARPPLQPGESTSQEDDAMAALASVSHKLPPAVAGKLGSGAKRYRSIHTRLLGDIAAGKLPPFCKNCGEIDTPTWRKCFVKTMQGVPETEKLSEEENFICWEVTDTDEAGTPLAYRIIKKSVTREEEGYEQQQLCNSCGIWLFKTKSMRPRDKWAKSAKSDKSGKPSKKRAAHVKTASAAAQSKTEAMGMDAEETALWSALTNERNDSNECALTDVSGRTDKSLPKSTGKRHRSSAADVMSRSDNIPFLADKSAMAALQRAIQSSPPKFPGSKTSPIDLSKESPQQGVRRLLFPSPRKEGEAKTLEGSPSTGTPTKSTGARVVQMQDPFADNTEEQENASEKLTTPKGKKSRVDLLKTPTRSSPRLKEKQEARLSAESRKHHNPETPSRAASQHITGAEMTPFTAQLNQMMSDGIGGFGDFGDMGQDPSGMFTMSNFENMDGFGLDNNNNMQMPQSDGDFFPVLDDTELMADMEAWNGGPLLEGELDELLKEAGDDAYLDGEDAATNGGPTPAETGPSAPV